MSLFTRIVDLKKLREAWKRVRKNKPAAGVDNVTCEQFEASSEAELKQLQTELINHTYKALPVRRVVLYREDKAREIALYSMRDKVVQQSVAIELDKHLDSSFSRQTYAYRSNKSALNAVGEISNKAMSGDYGYILKLDISHFFDEIQWDILQGILKDELGEEDVIYLIHENTCSVSLDEQTGDLVEKRRGIYQGSSISPILSNLYLREFDHWLQENTQYFVRYSDDILILGADRDELTRIMTEAALKLKTIGLQLNEKKSICVPVAEGVDFLGYHFDNAGKSIPKKAEASLQDRLETMWLTIGDIGVEQKIAKASEIVGGWEQYYREEREIGSIIEFVCLMRSAGDDAGRLQILTGKRSAISNVYRDVMLYLAEIWRGMDDDALELLEYEQYYEIPETASQRAENETHLVKELLEQYRHIVLTEDVETATNIMQSYTDLKCFKAASFWLQKKEQMDNRRILCASEVVRLRDKDAGAPIFSDKTAAKMMRLFAGREDIYSREAIGQGNRRQTELVTAPLTEKLIIDHLRGETTLATYVQRPNATVHYVVIDVDISKRVLLTIDRKSDLFTQYLQKALGEAVKVQEILGQMGMRGYIEYSGNRGYHVWLFFSEWIQTRYANMLCECLETRLTQDDDITVEFFPNKTRIKAGKFGQALKIPFGIHLKTGERSFFLDESGEPANELDSFLDGIARFSVGSVKRVLATSSGIREEVEKKETDRDLSAFGELDPNVREVLDKCNLMRYLCQRSVKTAYLSHFERMSVLYVFGHLGDEGKKFVHQVMSFTMNYSYNTTEKFIRRCPEKPISCIKLRDQYKMVTAEIGCDCAFKRTKNCYPSPVLHAITLSDEDRSGITLPTGRTLTKEKTSQVMDEINIHRKAQQLASRILEFRKQQRSIDKNIRSVERELHEIFDNAGIDSLETDLGLLVRRKKDTGYEWVIEI